MFLMKYMYSVSGHLVHASDFIFGIFKYIHSPHFPIKYIAHVYVGRHIFFVYMYGNKT